MNDFHSICQEYVVEDREKMKDVPELDHSHVTELRMLGLYQLKDNCEYVVHVDMRVFYLSLVLEGLIVSSVLN